MKNTTHIQRADGFAGVDVAKATLAVAYIQNNGKVKNLSGVDNDINGWRKLRDKLRAKRFGGVICMEPTSVYHLGVADYLSEAGFTVALVPCRGVKNYADCLNMRDKTDNGDAGIIASFGRTLHQSGKLRLYTPASAEQKHLRALVNAFIVADKERIANQVRMQTAPDEWQRETYREWWLEGKRRAKSLRKQIADYCRNTPAFAKMFADLITIPGVGEHTAAVFLASGAHLCDSARAAAAMFGMSPSVRESGSSVSSSGLSRVGHAGLRHALFPPAMSAMRHNPLAAALSGRMKARGAAGKKVVGACAHKLLRIMWGVANNGKPFNPRHTEQRPQTLAA